MFKYAFEPLLAAPQPQLEASLSAVSIVNLCSDMGSWSLVSMLDGQVSICLQLEWLQGRFS